MILISTIWHSGTHSLAEMLQEEGYTPKDWVWQHCGPEVETDGFDRILTTYRDPHRVGASWANRGRVGLSPRIDAKWFSQWRSWGELLPLAEIYEMDDLDRRLNGSGDPLQLHRDLDEGNMDRFYSYVPKDMIDFALDCALTVGDQRAKYRGDAHS